jgi:hypothetical protein
LSSRFGPRGSRVFGFERDAFLGALRGEIQNVDRATRSFSRDHERLFEHQVVTQYRAAVNGTSRAAGVRRTGIDYNGSPKRIFLAARFFLGDGGTPIRRSRACMS